MATPKLPNHPDNYVSPSAISVWFATINEDNSVNAWRDLGNCMDVSLNLTDEYLEHESARQGLLAKDKVVISKVDGELTFTIDELVGCNLLYMFKPKTAPDYTATLDVLDQKRLRLTGTTAFPIDLLAVETAYWDYCEMGWGGSYASGVLVRSADGVTTYTDGVDYDFVQATGTGTARTPATVARKAGAGIGDGDEVVVSYIYEREVTEYRLQEGAVMEGMLRLQCLNQIGPMFAYEFPFVSLKLEGDTAINPGEYMKQTMKAAILTPGSGVRGYFYLFDRFLKSVAATSC